MTWGNYNYTTILSLETKDTLDFNLYKVKITGYIFLTRSTGYLGVILVAKRLS